MAYPREDQWIRVEELAEQAAQLSPDESEEWLENLRALGEPASVLTLLGSWLDLTPPAPPLSERDEVADRYILRGKLGEGGMGTVWRATQKLIGRDVAIKTIHPALVTPALQERFLAEMEILGRLEHPGIVRIFDAGIHVLPSGNLVPFFAMELVEGLPLHHWAASRREDRTLILRAMSEICVAVQHAHDRKVVHRDLKPSNVLVRPTGHPVVLDFGIARMADGLSDDAHGVFSGTPHYAAPEQHLGRDRNFRTGESVDVYAAGAILFEVLTGRRLFEFPKGTPIAAIRRTVVEDVPPRLSEILPDCPPLLEEVVARAVRRDPADRYYSIASLARALADPAIIPTSAVSRPLPAWSPKKGAVVPGTQWMLMTRLGAGGAGEIWTGVQEKLGERRVFKFCDTEENARTLKRELTLFRLLKERVGRNPHFIQLHDVSLDQPPWYLMMEHVEALDLNAWHAFRTAGGAKLDSDVCVEIVAQVAEALQAAHECGILHRDIKPANILVRETEEETGEGVRTIEHPHVLIADFGIGQIVAEEVLRLGTRLGFTHTVSGLQPGSLSGTLLYMAPEVLEGNSPTARSDVYSLGVVLWQLLVGNLNLALDPADAIGQIGDSLLREDLRKCLAGDPGKRWPSAGDLAISLRQLPERRRTHAERQAEIASRERAAYRRGILRTAVIAAAVVVVVASTAVLAWRQSREARQSRARGALEQAANIFHLGNHAGRRQQGLNLLRDAATFPGDPVLLRSLSAGMLSLADLVPSPASDLHSSEPLQPRAGETVRVLGEGGRYLAIGRDLDGVQGVLDLVVNETGASRRFERRDFPWVPIPEDGFVKFSPDEEFVAVAGPETSRHILICATTTTTLKAYLFTEEDLQCFRWHPGNRVIATGSRSGAVRLWDLHSARDASSPGTSKSDFDLPPKLADPAIDVPFATLKGWRAGICDVEFEPEGRWMAALDAAGWLRVWSGFSPEGVPNLPPPAEAANPTAVQAIREPTLLLESKLDRADSRARLSIRKDVLVVLYPSEAPVAFALQPGDVFREVWVAPALRKIAWSMDGSQICVISGTDVHWLAREPLAPIKMVKGSNSAAVAFDPVSGTWILPTDQEFILRQLPEPRVASAVGLPKYASHPLSPAEKGQGARFGMASALDGRVAIYYGQRLQFFRGGHPEGGVSSAAIHGGDGLFADLVWNPSGTLATVVYANAQGLRAESYTTSNGRTSHAGTVISPGQRLIAGGDGVHLIERGIDFGIRVVHSGNGSRRTLDNSPASRQDAPLAISADGKWLAAVADRSTMRLIDAASGRHYSDLPSPRRTSIKQLSWHPSGEWLAAITDDGYVQVWSLRSWREWLKKNDLIDG